MFYYLSLQYSAIQKTVLRHDRLWSISGISHILSEINEIDMKRIAVDNKGHIIIAGGGKFTVRFDNRDDAERARAGLERLISTRLPMLEFQISSIVPAGSLKEAREIHELNGRPYPGIIHELSEKKRVFRGYGVTYNPHLTTCEECEEYPAEKGLYAPEGRRICRICDTARQMARIDLRGLKDKEDQTLTAIIRIYKKYVEHYRTERTPEIPLNMEDLFPDEKGEDKGRRIAVWLSDVNNMGDMLPLWLAQDEEKAIDTLDSLRELFIDAISSALLKVFPVSTWLEKEDKKGGRETTFIPFRLIVAGGDDLCIVMPDKYILSFAKTFSSEMNKKIEDAGTYNETLTRQWLIKKAKELNIEKDIKGLSFGSAFVVTSIHTPFTRIREVGEGLMGWAKKATDRKGNSINWRILAADEEPLSEKILKAERPLLIEEPHNGYLSFRDYIDLCSEYKKISGSHLYQIVEKIIEFNKNVVELEKWLFRMPEAGKKESIISKLINDDRFRDSEGRLKTERLITLFELLTLYED